MERTLRSNYDKRTQEDHLRRADQVLTRLAAESGNVARQAKATDLIADNRALKQRLSELETQLGIGVGA